MEFFNMMKQRFRADYVFTKFTFNIKVIYLFEEFRHAVRIFQLIIILIKLIKLVSGNFVIYYCLKVCIYFTSGYIIDFFLIEHREISYVLLLL